MKVDGTPRCPGNPLPGVLILVALMLALPALPSRAGLVSENKDSSVFIRGDYFRLVLDARYGGAISTLQLFDGGQWNDLFSGPERGFPALVFHDGEKEYHLGLDGEARISESARTEQDVLCSVDATPRAADGSASPWRVRLNYTVCAEGAVFVDLALILPAGTSAPGNVAVQFDAGDFVRGCPLFRDDNVAKQGHGFPSARIAFGANPARSFTNEVEVFVEHKRALSGQTLFERKDRGVFAWRLGKTAGTLSGPVEYRNTLALGLGAAVSGRPKSNVVGQRVFHWVNWLDLEHWYPTPEQIDKMAAANATMLILHMEWMKQRGSNGKPHADYAVARNHEDMVRAIEYAHGKGLRVGLYMRGVEPYALASGFFERYCRPEWDGLYVDWNGPTAVSWHESNYAPEVPLGDTHFTADGSQVPAKAYFQFTRKLREIVGAEGFLIGHQGSFNSGILANACFDAYLPGETGSDRRMFSDIAEAGYKGMLGGSVCMPWTLDLPAYRNAEGAAKMAAWGAYPHLVMGLRDEHTKSLTFTLEADAPEYAFILPYWRLLARIDVEKATLFNLPGQNLVSLVSSTPAVQGIVYRTGDSFLIIIANLGTSTASAELTLNPTALGMSGEYHITRIDPGSGAEYVEGVFQGSLVTGNLSPWGLAGFHLTSR